MSKQRRRGSIFPGLRKARSLSPPRTHTEVDGNDSDEDDDLNEKSVYFLAGLNSYRNENSTGSNRASKQAEIPSLPTRKRGVHFEDTRRSHKSSDHTHHHDAAVGQVKFMSRRRHTTNMAAMATQRFAAEALLQIQHTEGLLGQMRQSLYASAKKHASATAQSSTNRATKFISTENESISDVLLRLTNEIDHVRSSLTRLEERLNHATLFAPRRGVRMTKATSKVSPSRTSVRTMRFTQRLEVRWSDDDAGETEDEENSSRHTDDLQV